MFFVEILFHWAMIQTYRDFSQKKELFMRKRLVSIFLISLIAFFAFAQSNRETSGKTYTFKVSITQSSTDPLATYTQQWIKEVEEKTDGAVKLEFYPNGELGTINDVCEQVARGAAIIAYAGPDAYPTIAPDMAILNSQYCLTDASQIDAINNSDWFKEQNALLEKGGVHCLGWNYFTGYRHILCKKAIYTVDDLKGVQLRVATQPAAVFAEALGCNPIITNWNEVYSALSTNMINAAEAPLATLYSSSLQEVAKYCTLTNHLVSTGMMVVSSDRFNELPPEYQKILSEAVYKAGSDFTKYSLETEAEYKAKMEAAGVAFITPDVASFAKKASSMYTSGKLPFSDGLYEKIQAIIAK